MWERSALFIRRCWLFLLSPAEGATEVLTAHAYLGGILLNWASAIVWVRWVGDVLWPAGRSLAGYLTIAVIAALLAAAVGVTVVHLMARLFGGRGSWTAMLALGGYAALPVTLFMLVVGLGAVLWVRLFGPIPLHLAAVLIFILLTVSALILELVMLRGAVGANYGLSRRRAWATTLLAVLMLSATQSLLQRPHVERCRVTLANLQAMSNFPAIFRTASEYDALHFQFDVSANRACLGKLPVKRGDVMFFRSGEGQACLARVLALPGETVELKHGRLHVNGEELLEPWRSEGEVSAGPYRLGEADYFLWTDDRRSGLRLSERNDLLGVVARQRLIGPPMFQDEAVLGGLFPRSP